MKAATVSSNHTKMLFAAILAFQRRSRQTSTQLKLPISIIEGHALYQVLTDPAVNSQALAAELGIDPSTSHRLIQKLIKRKLVLSSVSKHHSRYKTLTLSQLGLNTYNVWEAGVWQAAEKLYQFLSETEKAVLIGNLQEIADGYLVAPVTRSSFHPLARQLFRLTRGSKLFSRSFFSTNFSLTDCQIISVLYESSAEQTATLLVNELCLEQSTISRALSKLKNQKLIDFNKREDARNNFLKLTALGIETAETMLQLGSDSITHSTKKWSTTKILQLTDYLRKCSEAHNVSHTVTGFKINRCKTKQQLKQLRNLYLKHLVFSRQELLIDQLPFSNLKCCFEIFRDQIIGGLEIEQPRRQKIKNSFWLAEGEFPIKEIEKLLFKLF